MADFVGIHHLIVPPQNFSVGRLAMIHWDNCLRLDHTSDADFGPFTTSDINLQIATPTLSGYTNTTGLFSFIPEAKHVGVHPLTVNVLQNDKIIGRSTTTITIKADGGKALKVAVLGDSLTQDGTWIDRVDAMLPNLTWLGVTNQTSGGNDHDGINGYSFFLLDQQFNNMPASSTPDSPLLSMAGADMDVDYWIGNLGDTPDVVIIALGINRVFNDVTNTYRATVAQEMDLAEEVVDKIEAAGIDVLWVTPTVGAYDEQVFIDQYPDPPNNPLLQDRYRWTIQHRYEMLEQQRRFFSRLPIASASSWVSPHDGYSPTDGIHPQSTGYFQFADCVASGLICRFR